MMASSRHGLHDELLGPDNPRPVEAGTLGVGKRPAVQTLQSVEGQLPARLSGLLGPVDLALVSVYLAVQNVCNRVHGGEEVEAALLSAQDPPTGSQG